jgi:PKD repeat protein
MEGVVSLALAAIAARHRIEAPSYVGVIQNTGIHKAMPGGGSFTFTPATPFTEGNGVVVVFGCYGLNATEIQTYFTVSINGVAAEFVKASNRDNECCAIFYGVAGSGSAGITIDSHGASGSLYINAGAIECDDIDSVDVTATANGSSASISATTGALASSNARVVAVSTGGNNTTVGVTLDAADTLIYKNTDGNSEVPSTAAYRAASGAGAQTVTWAAASSMQWSMSVAAFKLKGSGGGPPANANPVAAFTYSIDDMDVDFTDTSTDSDGTVVAWSWDFGDGNTSTSQNPSHTYDDAGSYDVQLTVTDDDGGTNSVTHTLNVGSMAEFTGVTHVGGYTITSTSNAQRYPDDVGTYTDHPTVETPGTPVAGDKMYFAIGCTGRGPIDWTGSGFTEINAEGGGGSDGFYIGERTCDGSESGTITIETTTGASDWLAVCVLVHADSGNALTTVSHDSNINYGGTGTTVPVNAPDDTATTGANQLVLSLFSTSSTAETGDLLNLALPSGFVLGALIKDSVREFVAAAAKQVTSATTDTYDVTATLTGSGNVEGYYGVIVLSTDSEPPDNVDPVAAFTFDADDLEVTFTDTSTDSDGTVSS